MAKEVTKENLREYAETHLRDTASAVLAGLMDAKTAKGHARELFYLSATFGLDIQDEARKVVNEMKAAISDRS